MLKELHAAQVLPVGIFDPTGQNVFIAEVVHVLEVMQGDHQASADGRATLIRAVGRAEQLVESIPVNRPVNLTRGWRKSMIWQSSEPNKSSCRLCWGDRFGFIGKICKLSVVLLSKSCKLYGIKSIVCPVILYRYDNFQDRLY